MSVPGPRRKAKEIPRLPLSAFTPTDIPPTPTFLVPAAIADAHLRKAAAQTRAVVQLQSDTRVLLPFALDSTETPQVPPSPSLALTAVYNGTIPVAVDAEEEAKDQAQVETPVKNLRWALQHGCVVDLDIQGSILATDAPFYDTLVNLLTKATNTNSERTPIVLTNVLPPPLDSLMPVVTLMNHPTYTTYRQRVSLLSLFENVSVKLLPPTWVSTESTENRDKDLKNVLKLFIAPVLEAFGFERIVFGSSPAFGSGSPALAESWYGLVLDSFRDLAVSQDEMNKIFMENTERLYGSR